MNFQIEEVNKAEDDVIAYVHLRSDKGTKQRDNYSQLHLSDKNNLIALPAPTEKVLWAFNFKNIDQG